MAASHNILLFGGTFDPVHKGHLNIAKTVQDHFQFERFVFLPCKIPVLKKNAQATPQQRLDMLRLALSENPDYPFEIDAREMYRESPSYTVITLEDYRKELGPDVSITLLMGVDSFSTLPGWHKWQNILLLANILVIDRANHSDLTSNNPVLSQIMKQHKTADERALLQHSHGLIYNYHAGLYDVSSTAIRDRSGSDIAMPDSVRRYIEENCLYLV